jgi:exosortase E/protease (VPEID-CTERM system)
MSATIPDTGTAITPGASALPLTRWVGLAVLMCVEILSLSLLFDTDVFDRDPRWWAGLMRYSSRVPKMALIVAVATLIFGGRRFTNGLKRLSNHCVRPHRTGLLLAGQLTAFVCFALLTACVWDEPVHPTPFGGWKLLAWTLAGLATAVLWVATAVPFSFWMEISRREMGVLAFGTLIVAVTSEMSRQTQSLWASLSRSTFWVVERLLRLIFRDVISDPAGLIVGTPAFSVSIAPQCSGYEGIGLIWAFVSVALWLFRDRFQFPRAFLLFPIGTAAIWLANAARIAALVAIGTLISPKIAVGGFHSMAGWLSFNLIGLGMIAIAQRSRFFGSARSRVVPRSNPTAAYLMPLLVLVGTSMVTGAFSSGFDRYYPLRVAAAATALAWYWREYSTELRPTWSWGVVGIGIVVFVIWMALEPPVTPNGVGYDPRDELSPTWAGVWLLARVFGSVLIVPLAEELAFRGYLIRRLIAADFRSVPPGHLTWVSVAASSVAFGALHGRWLAGTLAGASYALALGRRGRLADAVLAHATTNALIAADVLATHNWSLWS